MDIESAIQTLEEAVRRANGNVFTQPLKTKDVELALRVLRRLAAPLRTRDRKIIGHRTLHMRDWVMEKYD